MPRRVARRRPERPSHASTSCCCVCRLSSSTDVRGAVVVQLHVPLATPRSVAPLPLSRVTLSSHVILHMLIRLHTNTTSPQFDHARASAQLSQDETRVRPQCADPRRGARAPPRRGGLSDSKCGRCGRDRAPSAVEPRSAALRAARSAVAILGRSVLRRPRWRALTHTRVGHVCACVIATPPHRGTAAYPWAHPHTHGVTAAAPPPLFVRGSTVGRLDRAAARACKRSARRPAPHSVLKPPPVATRSSRGFLNSATSTARAFPAKERGQGAQL